MRIHRDSRDLAVALGAAVVAVACAVALTVGPSMHHGHVVADAPYPTGPAFLGSRGSPVASCAVPALPGAVVDITLTDMHAMMGHGMGFRGPGMGMMRILVQPATVAPGEASFRVTNAGRLRDELVVLPLTRGRYPGQRAINADGTVEETGSLGEVSDGCGAQRDDDDPGTDGIAPGGIGWTTVTLTPGRYELICNIPGHYWTGMYAELDVSPPD
ncbi:sulfocyanin [Mycobacterium sp. Y57]|uniref:sulfocyanin n=1 Tax=Mycolicibacterium xanthum TaxID=2796469 RepID=UPI001C852164|nr:sulfocyanin [Mycolicibacterium xanthum]MBX7434705.1 sulfocyanin [Mycolicibacterium xanthum]